MRGGVLWYFFRMLGGSGVRAASRRALGRWLERKSGVSMPANEFVRSSESMGLEDAMPTDIPQGYLHHASKKSRPASPTVYVGETHE